MNAKAWKLLILCATLAGMAAAADEDVGRGVARVSLLNGDVSVRRGDSGDWVAAALNAPLVVEDALTTGANSRAEVQFDWANMIRLAADTEVRLAVLEDQRYNVQVARGLVTFRVERDSDADVEISTPSVSVRPVKKGSYRIYVREDGESEITVRSGEAEIFTPTGRERLKSGRTMLARGTASDPEFRVVSAAREDNWDRWNEDRDSYYSRTNAYRYTDSSVYGVEDLDGYGSWDYVAPYGYVWSPRVDVGWAPYYYGRWSWIDWYGWNWVSYDPWGWAPYHYGRWFYQGSRWCWWPGGLHSRQYWSPGLVAFFGWGGFGRVGWIPLAPHEPYYPWYSRGYYSGYRNSTYIDNSVHIVNNTNIVNNYRNARITNGITAVNSSDFGRGGATNIRVNRADVGRVDLVRGQLPVAPNRDSLQVSDRRAAAMPQRSTPPNREFFSRRPAPLVERVPFEQQQRGMEQVARRTFGAAPAAPAARADVPARVQGSAAERTAPAARAEVPARVQGSAAERTTVPAAENTGAGWRQAGEAPRPAVRPSVEPRTTESPRVAPAPRVPQSSDNGNWPRFETNRDSGSSGREPAAAPRSVERSWPTPRQTESPRMSEPPRATPQAAPERRSEPIRISPPIVRQREAPARMEAPRAPSAPSGGGASMRSAPSEGGGGGSTRSAPSGGGGSGGGRSEGGGRVSPGSSRNR